MIYWAPFLHFYQPSIQFHAVLQKICNESYRPLIKVFKEHPLAKVTVNMSGVLTEMLQFHNAKDVLGGLSDLAQEGKLEFVGSAKFHPILPLLSIEEIKRQIKLNRKVNEHYFGAAYKPCGFFPPEMCYSSKLDKVIKSMGYEWMLISGVAHQDKWPLDFVSSVQRGSSCIKVFFRDDVLSNKVSFHKLDSVGFIKELVEISKGRRDSYIITAMDAETFGHHIPNLEREFLVEVYNVIEAIQHSKNFDDIRKQENLDKSIKDFILDLKELPKIKIVTISELLDAFPSRVAKPPKPSSWSTDKEDILRKNYYPLWKDAGNIVHTLQWEHLDICCELVHRASKLKGEGKEAHDFANISRSILDKAVHSCQFWWANKSRNLWSINLINKGLILQEEAIINAYKAISLSSADNQIRKYFYHKTLASRNIANSIRDLLIEK